MNLKNKKEAKIETERLILEPVKLEDAAFIFELMNCPKFIRFIGDRNINSIEDAEKYILIKMLPQYIRLGYGNFIIQLKSENRKIGTCGIFDRDGMEGLDLGYALLPEHEGKGYAFEAASKILELAFEHYNTDVVFAITSKSNERSIHLIKKLGMKFKDEMYLPDDPELLYRFYKKIAINK